MMRMDSPLEHGSKFGRLTVSSGPKRIDGYIRFECVCECGSTILAKGTALRSGNTKSCGCLRKDNDRTRRESMPEWSICGIAGCENKARTRKGHRCEKHYYRMRRKGEYSDPVYGYRTITSHGYVSVTARGHPVAMNSGRCYEHRRVFYDSVNGENQECHWCRREIVWSGDGEKIVVDHLDNNKENNDESNLVASCHKCNSIRGLFMKWVHDHIDDPFLTKLFNQSNSGTDGFPLKPRKG